MMRKHLRVLMALLATLVLCASLVAKTNKQAEKLFKQAQLAEVKQQWDEALTLYQKATDLDPTNQSYQLGMRRTRFQAGQKHVNVGQKLRNDGKIPRGHPGISEGHCGRPVLGHRLAGTQTHPGHDR